MKKEKDEVKEELAKLCRHSIIEYVPQKDSPQLMFMRDRVKADDLSLNLKALKSRKQKFVARIESFIRYVNETVECRSRSIASYFGDDNLKDCGICDTCLKQKSVHLSKQEFETINNRIIDSVKNQSIHAKELMHQLKGIQKEKAWKVLTFLQSEDKIELDRTGLIRLK
jgi:ATP-dependent DNA helicase RecQ